MSSLFSERPHTAPWLLRPSLQWDIATIPYGIKLLGLAAGQGQPGFVTSRVLPKVETTGVPAALAALLDRCVASRTAESAQFVRPGDRRVWCCGRPHRVCVPWSGHQQRPRCAAGVNDFGASHSRRYCSVMLKG